MKKQFKLLFFVAMLVTLVVMTMVMASAAEGDAFALTRNGETEPYQTFATLKAAFEAAQDGDTITVLAEEVTVSDAITITATQSKSITFDGTGATITVNVDGSSWIIVGDNVSLTMTNVKATMSAGEATAALSVATGLVEITGASEVTVTDSTLVNENTTKFTAGFALTGVGGGTLNLTDNEVTGFQAIIDYPTATTGRIVNIYSGTYNGGAESADSRAIWVLTANSTINVFGGTLEGYNAAIRAQGASMINIFDGTLKMSQASDTLGVVYFHAANSTLNVYGGTLEAEAATICYFYRASKVNIYGGTISSGITYFNNNNSTNVDGMELTIGVIGEAHTPKNADGSTVKRNGVEMSPITETTLEEIVAKGAIFIEARNRTATYNFGNGVTIRMQAEKLFNRATKATVNVTGAVTYYAENGVLPNAGEEWDAATFYIHPTTVTLPAADTAYTFANVAEAVALVKGLADWDPMGEVDFTYNKANVFFFDGEAPSFVVGEGVALEITGGSYSCLNSSFIDVQGGTLTINATVTAANGAVLSVSAGTVTIAGGMYVGNQIVAGEGTATVSVQGGTFIQKGTEGSVFGYENAVVSGNALVLAPVGVIYSGTKAFDSYAPVVKYAGVSYKFWTELEGAEAGAPVIELGASIYLGADGRGDDKADCGIRFDSSFDSTSVPAGYTWIYNEGTGVTGLGHIIAPADYVAAVIAQGGSFTIDSFKDHGVAYLDIPATMSCLDKQGSVVSFAAAIYNLFDTTRAYAAVPYAVFTNDSTGEVEYFYGAYDAVENSRSAEQIACYYYESGDPIYTIYDVMAQYYTPTASASEEE